MTVDELQELLRDVWNRELSADEAWEFMAHEYESLQKDAARYRWLMDVASTSNWEDVAHNTIPSNTDNYLDNYMKANEV